MRRFVGVAGTVILLSSCVTSPTGRSQLMLISADEETKMGAQAYQEVLGSSKILASGPEVTRVRTVGERIAKVTGESYQWEFNVIDDPKTVNAFCLPGGKVAVYTGILPLATTDDELAVVMGHEIAHATCHHGGERVSQNVIAQLGLSAADLLLSGQSESTRQLAIAALGAGAQVGVLLPYSREHESEADTVGLNYMYDAGYDPAAGAEFWKKMEAQGGGAPPAFLSTHPAPEARMENLAKLAVELKKRPREAVSPKQSTTTK